MKSKQRERHEYKMYLKCLRYGARNEVITSPAVRELIMNKKKRRGQQILRYYKRRKDTAWAWLKKEMEGLKSESKRTKKEQIQGN